MLYIIALLVALVSYFIGSISGAILISKSINGEDIRNSGSKNPGTTNMLRIYGKKAAVFTLLIDVLKGVVAVAIGILIDYMLTKTLDFSIYESSFLFGSMKYIAGIFAVIGHDFPVFFRFKGGKGVATSLGVILMLDWKIGLIVMIGSLLIMIFSRYVSLGSIAAAVIYPCIVAAFVISNKELKIMYLVCAVILGLLIIFKHHTNIVRLKNGTENKLFSKK